MPTGEGTSADAELLYRLSLRDIPATVRKLQEWRRLGIVSSPQIVYHGRKGTEALAYPPGTEDEVAAVVRMLDIHRDLDLVVLGLFGAGVIPTERAVRAAYANFLDESEAGDLKSLALSEAGSDLFSKRVNKYASAVRKDLPEIVDRWNADARSRAKAESRIVDVATEEAVRVTSKDIRERDAEAFILALLGEKGGDASALLRAFGAREERVAGMKADGGIPSYRECRAALDAAAFSSLVATRDLVRGSWHTFVAEEMPEVLGAFLIPLLDAPEAFGLTVAFAVMSATVFFARDPKEVSLAMK
jgi:hypothetical protein